MEIRLIVLREGEMELSQIVKDASQLHKWHGSFLKTNTVGPRLIGPIGTKDFSPLS